MRATLVKHSYPQIILAGVRMINFSGQCALITGGSRGIGAATALMFAEAGADVAITYAQDGASAKKMVDKINSLGRGSDALRCRVERYGECQRLTSLVLERFGRIDILINNAGIWEGGRIGKMSSAEWNKTLRINLTGTFNMCNSIVPLMKKQKYGRIINISSTAGQRGEPFHSHYAASKGGIIAFTKSIAPELIKFGIWVNCVAPGWVKTDMISRVSGMSARSKEINRSIPRGRAGMACEIAGPILFLASNLADHVVGEVLNVNGGGVLCG